MTGNFDMLAGLVKGQLLGQLQQQAEVAPMSVLIYSCPNGHQAVKVRSGQAKFSLLATLPADGTCPICAGQKGIVVKMR